jgi:hypothetical protein
MPIRIAAPVVRRDDPFRRVPAVYEDDAAGSVDAVTHGLWPTVVPGAAGVVG